MENAVLSGVCCLFAQGALVSESRDKLASEIIGYTPTHMLRINDCLILRGQFSIGNDLGILVKSIDAEVLPIYSGCSKCADPTFDDNTSQGPH